MKTCKRCKIELDTTCFCKNNRKKDGLHPYCRKCCSEINLEFRETNPDYHREHYLNNKVRIQIRVEAWSEKNKDKMKAYRAKYYKANVDKINARRRARNAEIKALSSQRRVRNLQTMGFRV